MSGAAGTRGCRRRPRSGAPPETGSRARTHHSESDHRRPRRGRSGAWTWRRRRRWADSSPYGRSPF
ncbi:hypothetical protein DDE05_08055, partial [Streptomyces cavourensis]